MNVPKQIFNFPFGCYETDSLEALSLLLFSHSKMSKGKDLVLGSRVRSVLSNVRENCESLITRETHSCIEHRYKGDGNDGYVV